MLKSTFQVAKIVASTTDVAWSQAYHAGGLTAILSVCQKEKSLSTVSLPIVGKDLLNTFESEYFTLETKNLTSIAKAVELTYKKSSGTHSVSLLVAACIQNALYIVLAGTGNICLLRKDHIGTILTKEDPADEKILAASGFLEDEDMVILETLSFAKIIPSEQLTDTLTKVSLDDAVETMTPKIQKEHDGSEAALFFQYREEKTLHHPFDEHEEKSQEEPTVQTP